MAEPDLEHWYGMIETADCIIYNTYQIVDARGNGWYYLRLVEILKAWDDDEEERQTYDPEIHIAGGSHYMCQIYTARLLSTGYMKVYLGGGEFEMLSNPDLEEM